MIRSVLATIFLLQHTSRTPPGPFTRHKALQGATSITKRSRCLVTGHKKLIFLDSGHMSLSGVCVCALPHLAQIVYMVLAQCRINGQFCSVHDGANKGRIQLLRVPPISRVSRKSSASLNESRVARRVLLRRGETLFCKEGSCSFPHQRQRG